MRNLFVESVCPSRSLSVAVEDMAVGLSAPEAGAQPPTCTISWNNTSGGNWNTAADWTVSGGGNRVPTSTDDVCITLPGTYTVTLTGSVSVNEIAIGNTPANAGDTRR